MRQVDPLNLKRALNEILKRVVNNEPMNFGKLCKDCNLGNSTIKRLKYALLEHKYTIPKSDKPLCKMKVSKDGKTWNFIFRSSVGSRNWNFIEEDFDSISEAMKACPPEVADPIYYKSKTVTEDTKQVIEENPLLNFTVEQLCAEIKRRGFTVSLLYD